MDIHANIIEDKKRNTISIRSWAFHECTNLKKVVLPSGIPYIEEDAFDTGSKTDDLILYSVGESYAESYAKTANISFVPVQFFLANAVLIDNNISVEVHKVDKTYNRDATLSVGEYGENKQLLKIVTLQLEDKEQYTISTNAQEVWVYKIFVWNSEIQPLSNGIAIE